MLSLLKSKVALAVGAALLFTSLSAVAMGKLYLDKRDDFEKQKFITSVAEARAKNYIEQLKDEQERTRALEQLRIDLSNQIALLENQEVEVITEVRELWRDREVIVNNPIAVECSGEPVPDRILSLLCQSDNRGACADLQPGA